MLQLDGVVVLKPGHACSIGLGAAYSLTNWPRVSCPTSVRTTMPAVGVRNTRKRTPVLFSSIQPRYCCNVSWHALKYSCHVLFLLIFWHAVAFKKLPSGLMPPLFSAILNSAVIGIYDGKIPACTAVFFSPTRALTVFHDAKPKVGDMLIGASAPNVQPVRKWKFVVVASNHKADLVVLEIVSGPTPVHFLPISAGGSISSIRHAKVWLATFGISVAKMAAENPSDIALGSYADKTQVAATGARHFVYHTDTGRGDSGGAVMTMDGKLVGLHLGGWNDSSPFPSPATATAGDKRHRGGSRGRGARRHTRSCLLNLLPSSRTTSEPWLWGLRCWAQQHRRPFSNWQNS